MSFLLIMILLLSDGKFSLLIQTIFLYTTVKFNDHGVAIKTLIFI